jgi:hypothetical protein
LPYADDDRRARGADLLREWVCHHDRRSSGAKLTLERAIWLAAPSTVRLTALGATSDPKTKQHVEVKLNKNRIHTH